MVAQLATCSAAIALTTRRLPALPAIFTVAAPMQNLHDRWFSDIRKDMLAGLVLALALMRFVSRKVVSGFVNALDILIFKSQLPRALVDLDTPAPKLPVTCAPSAGHSSSSGYRVLPELTSPCVPCIVWSNCSINGTMLCRIPLPVALSGSDSSPAMNTTHPLSRRLSLGL